MKAIVNANLYDFTDYKENQYVLFDEKIEEVGPMADFVDKGYEVTDGQGCLLMPGLVNGHGHIYSTFARGMALPFDPKDFKGILEQLWWRLDRGLTLEDVYYSGVVHSRDALLSGVTTIVDHHASGEISGSLNALKKAVVDEAGMRGVFCFETSDRFDVAACIDENIKFMTESQSDKCAGLFGLHASMTLSDETLEKVHQVIGDKPIHIHVAESKFDQEDAMARFGKTVIDRLSEHGLLNSGSLLAHCLFVDEREAKMVADSGSTVVFNISSNMNNSVGMPDYQQLRKAGVPVMVGNDGISSAIVPEWLNLLFGSHLKDGKPTEFGMDSLHEIILENYKFVNRCFGTKLGRIQAGCESDLIMVPYINPTPLNGDNALGHLVFGLGGGLKPRHVWCQGIQRVCDYEVSEQHLNKYRESADLAEALWQRL